MYWAYGTGQQKWLGHTHCNEMTIVVPNKHCNGHHGATEIEGEQGEKRFRVRNRDHGIHVQLEEDGGGSTRESWIRQVAVASVPLGMKRHVK